jgi:hypothetical protein
MALPRASPDGGPSWQATRCQPGRPAEGSADETAAPSPDMPIGSRPGLFPFLKHAGIEMKWLPRVGLQEVHVGVFGVQQHVSLPGGDGRRHDENSRSALLQPRLSRAAGTNPVRHVVQTARAKPK